ncbi:radical SAM family heme chaperone HemW [Seleniivibrio sp.]|uniref:radical SAM family heme chaperone HemW n=1 Tax=Seleniivibrio sp. TaxID=2898801 RepID=UPI0025D05A78|nr:radical SAM family heme chaperone HemW [Seleniivibrio sp.]MCD8553793.1 radical SAM family heme chaperone HemW [Seleniivibrio sp.]
MSGLYVHVPFCKSKCGYCGFYSAPDAYHLTEKYFDAVLKDLSARKKKKYDTLYIGGGTPSSVSPVLLSVFLEKLFSAIGSDFAESTIEANPESVSEDFLSVIKGFGFSRLSVGCQSTDEDVLKLLGRIHGRDDIFKTAELARKICPETALNLDMIFDIPTVENYVQMQTLADIISLSAEHVSAYSYSFDTEFLKDAEPCGESAFIDVKRALGAVGYGKYEISNFAKAGHESRHNIGYWKLEDYDGLGCAAWSLENFSGGRVLYGKVSDVGSYIANPTAFAETDRTEGSAAMGQELVFGLRMLDGVDVSSLKYRYGDLMNIFDGRIETLVAEGMLTWQKDRLKLTEKGELLLDSVQEYLWDCLP